MILFDIASAPEQEQWDILQDAERQRANRYLRDAPRWAFVHARSRLRQELAKRLGIADPSSIEFVLGRHGKPYLAPAFFEKYGLYFNVSHSHSLGALVISEGVEVGVDIEYMNEKTDIKQLMPRVFSQFERSSVLDLDEPLQREAFFRIWSRKEAYIKALGMGLALDLRSFDVSCGQDAKLLSARHLGKGEGFWKFEQVEAPDNYALALVVKTKS